MTSHPFPAHWGKPSGVYVHRTAGTAYGPSDPNETLESYKARVKGAYGTLRGVTFHDVREEPHAAT